MTYGEASRDITQWVSSGKTDSDGLLEHIVGFYDAVRRQIRATDNMGEPEPPDAGFWLLLEDDAEMAFRRIRELVEHGGNVTEIEL